MDRFAATVANHGMTVFARIDHEAAAAKIGMDLRPTEVLVFGSPRAGTPLMQAAQTIGIDLPLRALVWEDEAGKIWLACTDPKWVAAHHNVRAGVVEVLNTMTESLAASVAAAAISVT